MKKTLLIVGLVIISMVAKAEVEFAYEAGAELVSAYLWRGQYNGGLSFQPDVEIGYDGEHTSLRVGAWASLGATDWKFQTGLDKDEEGNETIYNPLIIDIIKEAVPNSEVDGITKEDFKKLMQNIAQ